MKPKPDYIAHMNAAWDGAFHPQGEWATRAINGPLHDVDAYGSRAAAERAIALAPVYNIPALELVRRCDDRYCNVW